MRIVVKEMIRESFVSYVITCATDRSQDDEFTRLKEGKLCHEGRKLLREQFQLLCKIQKILIQSFFLNGLSLYTDFGILS